MRTAQKNITEEKSRRKSIALFIVPMALIVLGIGAYLVSRGVSDESSIHKTTILVQEAQDRQRSQFEFYLRQPSAPQNDQELSQLIQNKYLVHAAAWGEDADYVVGHGVKDGELYIDIVTSRTYTLQSAGGLTNENRIFVMCTRLNGKASPTAQVRSIDIPCPAQAITSPTGEQRDAPTLIKLAR